MFWRLLSIVAPLLYIILTAIYPSREHLQRNIVVSCTGAGNYVRFCSCASEVILSTYSRWMAPVYMLTDRQFDYRRTEEVVRMCNP
jgi:hypothetical protein